MPIYEYAPVDGECNICGGKFELRRPADREALTECPLCRKPVRKLISEINTPKIIKPVSYADAKKAGFTLLKKRDQGVYEKL